MLNFRFHSITCIRIPKFTYAIQLKCFERQRYGKFSDCEYGKNEKRKTKNIYINICMYCFYSLSLNGIGVSRMVKVKSGRKLKKSSGQQTELNPFELKYNRTKHKVYLSGWVGY